LQTFATVIQKNDIHQKFALIDNRLVWYGSFDILGYGNSEESIMRLESKELSEELKTSITSL
jgi:phosphatidylserine/phosphatidylglycerophosphate/cardiolipin synthase-like enzyme